ncbi:MAG TPA: hypothetical protein VF765_25760 [Polyangiaceae bacterium]
MTRTGSSRPPRGVSRLEEALADAERMAKRVDSVLEQDPFAAALLAREYLSMVQELDVNPLNQRGRTDAWTSAFVRLRVASNMLDRHASRADGEAYLAARVEERRLFVMFGKAPRARLTAVRVEARSKRAQKRAFTVAAWLSATGGLVAVAVAFALGRPSIAALTAVAGVLCAAAGFLAAGFADRAADKATQRAVELEGGITGLAQFEASDQGRAIIQRIQREHPLLLRTSLGDSSTPPRPANEQLTARK